MRIETLRVVVLLLVCLAITFTPSIVGAQSRPDAWYRQLNKPALTPPPWVFPVAWTILYIMMAVAVWLVVWKVGLKKALLPVAVFALQLILNALWSYIFFTLHRPGLAFVELIVLWAAILVTLILFYRHYRLAGALLVPYLLWVTFAAYLNFDIYRLNR